MQRKNLSIITVTFNAASTLADCVESVLRHKDAEVEFVVIDAASKDDTLAILSRYGESIDILVSEPDKGIYDAMNKGIERASGEYLFFLGADDILLEIPWQELSQGADLVLGDVDCGSWIYRHLRPEESLLARMRYRNGVHPQGAFYRRTDVRFDLTYRYCADYLFNISHLERTKQLVYSNCVVSRFCTEGASAGWPAKKESIAIARHQFGQIAYMQSFLYHLVSHILNEIRLRCGR